MAAPPPPPPPPPISGSTRAVHIENGGHYDGVPRGKPVSSNLICFMNVLNTVTHLILGAVATSAIMFANWTSGSLAVHIYLCVTGYIILMTQAILSINPYAGWAGNFKYQEKKIIHLVMQVIGSVLAITGSAIRIADLNTNFQTTHAILGVLAMILTIFSLIGGVVSFFSDGLIISPVVLKTLHSCFGSLTLIVSFCCLALGFNKLPYRLITNDINADLNISLTVFALVAVLIPPTVNSYKRIKG